MKHLLLLLTNFFSQKKRFFACALTLLFISALSLTPYSAHAEGFDPLAIFGGIAIGTITSPMAFVAWLAFKITSFLLGLAGVIFNWAVLLVVFDFAKYFGNSPGMTLAWGILRDFANIGLLFGFVFMGIATILDLHKYPWSKALPKLVIYAVLLNFSLFATEAIIDATNVVSATLYQQTYAEAQQCTDANWLGCVINTGLAAVVLDRIHLSSVYTPDIISNTVTGFADQFTKPVENILKYVLLSLVTVVAATVFFGAASMLISRGITLAFLMVTSPLGFAGLAIPFLEGMARKWWKKLIDQALFAPVFILLLLASLKMTDGLDQIVGTGGLSAALQLGNVGDSTGTLIFFTLTMGFMVAALAMAQQFGIYGSDAVMKGAMDVIGRVGGLPIGTAGWIGRRTIGSASNALSRGIRTNDVLKNRPILGGALLKVTDAGARASFDIRGKNSGLGQASDAAQKGRRGEFDEIVKRKEEGKKLIDQADKEKYELAKLEKDRIEDIAVGRRSAADIANLAKAQRQMGETTTGKQEKEKEKKEEFDGKVKDWNDASAQFKEATAKLENIDRQLAAENDKIAQGQAANTRLIAELTRQRGEHEIKRDDAEREQTRLEGDITLLGTEINNLRRTIKAEQSAYRRNVQKAALPNVAGLSVLDRAALRSAALSIKKSAETGFKPQNLNDALSKGLKARITLPNP